MRYHGVRSKENGTILRETIGKRRIISLWLFADLGISNGLLSLAHLAANTRSKAQASQSGKKLCRLGVEQQKVDSDFPRRN